MVIFNSSVKLPEGIVSVIFHGKSHGNTAMLGAMLGAGTYV